MSSQNSDDNVGGNAGQVKERITKQNGKTVRFQTDTDSRYINQETNDVYDNDLDTKNIDAIENTPGNDCNFNTSPSPEESKATNGSSKQLRSSIQTKVSVDDIHCRDIEKGVNKRH